MNDFTKIEALLGEVKSKIDAHNEFKQEYDKQLAFDFSLFNFFNVGENKVSQILAYFLDENQNHGQGNIFLNEFVNLFYNEETDTTDYSVNCEKTITNDRRIDIYIELKNIVIAIENKIWAGDQYNQLKDYAEYLERESEGKFLLLYLTPYGSEPSNKSIDEGFKQKLIDDGKFKVISYKHDIINLINKWLVICEADNVSHFIKEFKKFIEVKFIGNNTLNMSKKLREIIYQNETEVQCLVNEYRAIEQEIIDKLNGVGKALAEETPNLNVGLNIKKRGLFNWYGSRYYKDSISNGNNEIWIQYEQTGINLYSNYYFEEKTDPKFKEIAEKALLKYSGVEDYKKSETELVRLFIGRVEIVNKIFEEYQVIVPQK